MSLYEGREIIFLWFNKEERCSMNIPKAGGQTICAPIEYGRNTKRALMSRSQREWRLMRRAGETG